MSHRTLEQVFVRMLFDPQLVDAVYHDPGTALAGLDLAGHEIEQLVSVDRRAWRYDPLRRYRTLRTLSEEFKTSTTLAFASTRSLGALDAFFSSAEFHDSVQHRGSMALAFARFFERLIAEKSIEEPQLSDVLRLETMLVRCRRSLQSDATPPESEGIIDGDTVLALAPGHAVGRFNGNIIATMNAVEQYLFEVGLMPAVALCDDGPRLEAIPPVSDEPVFFLILPSSTDVSLLPLDADYFTLLDQFSRGPLPLAVAAALAIQRGVPRGDLDTMVGSLIDEQALVVSRES